MLTDYIIYLLSTGILEMMNAAIPLNIKTKIAITGTENTGVKVSAVRPMVLKAMIKKS